MRKILATLIATTALLIVSAPASSAELTGCVTKRGTLANVAPGPRPAAPCGQRAKKVSVPVALNAGKPGTARVDSYTFWKEIDSEEFGEIPIILVKMPQHKRPIGFWGGCAQFQDYINRNVMMRVDLVTSMVTDPGQPTRCTFSGTADLFRAR